MTTHVWNLGVVQNQEFPKRITLVHAARVNSYYVLVTNSGGGPVKIIHGAAVVATLPAGQSAAVAADTDIHLELEEGPRRGATGNFSIVA